MKKQANYYMVIPAKVWNTKINPQAILLYGHISVLVNKEGFCWASNSYFEEVLDLSEATVSRCLATLEKIGVIRRELIYVPGTKQIQQRKIFIIDNQVVSQMNIAGITDDTRLVSRMTIGPGITDDQDNSTSLLNTINPNNIKKIKQVKQKSLDAGTPQAGAEAGLDSKFNFLFERVEQAFESRRIKIGDRARAFQFFKIIGNEVAEGLIYRLANDWNFKPTSLEDWLEDEVTVMD